VTFETPLSRVRITRLSRSDDDDDDEMRSEHSLICFLIGKEDY